MSSYYYEDKEKTIIKKELLNEKAQEIAEKFFSVDSKGHQREGLTSAQLRRFYNEVKSLEKRLVPGNFKTLLPLIKMIKSKVAYASNPRRSSRITPEFRKFIDECIDNIPEDGEKDFKAFALHFEAVVGFYYGKGVKQ
jgi:CRISPR-associated protein Csm2